MRNQSELEVQKQQVAEQVSAQLDRDQEDVMSARSSDGRPPPSTLMRNEWRWFAIGVGLLFAALVVWMVVSRASTGSVAAGVAYVALLIAAASPVIGAGLLRGGEERAAHKAVRTRVRELRSAEPGVRAQATEGEEVADVVVRAADAEYHETAMTRHAGGVGQRVEDGGTS